MTTLRAATNSNHNLTSKVLVGVTIIFILVLSVLATIFLVAFVSVG